MQNTCYILLHSYLIITRTLRGGETVFLEDIGSEKPRFAQDKDSPSLP